LQIHIFKFELKDAGFETKNAFVYYLVECKSIAKNMDRQKWEEILDEIEKLNALHEEGASNPKKCRDFNAHASLFLDRLEGMGATELADRMMDLLAGCSPKDFSPCDNRQLTKGSLERLTETAKAHIKKGN
jgi:hypothetical protein